MIYTILKTVFCKYPVLIGLLPKKWGAFWSDVEMEERQVCWLKDQDCQDE